MSVVQLRHQPLFRFIAIALKDEATVSVSGESDRQ